MIFVPIAFMFSSISGGGHISQNQNATLTCIQLFHLGGGVHQPESKCHLDLESNFFIPGGGGTSARIKMSP